MAVAGTELDDLTSDWCATQNLVRYTQQNLWLSVTCQAEHPASWR